MNSTDRPLTSSSSSIVAKVREKILMWFVWFHFIQNHFYKNKYKKCKMLCYHCRCLFITSYRRAAVQTWFCSVFCSGWSLWSQQAQFSLLVSTRVSVHGHPHIFTPKQQRGKFNVHWVCGNEFSQTSCFNAERNQRSVGCDGRGHVEISQQVLVTQIDLTELSHHFYRCVN